MERSRPKGRFYLYPGAAGWNMFTIGTWEDLRADDVVPVAGMRLEFYDHDQTEKGEPGWLLFEGTIRQDPDDGRWCADIDPESYRVEAVKRP